MRLPSTGMAGQEEEGSVEPSREDRFTPGYLRTRAGSGRDRGADLLSEPGGTWSARDYAGAGAGWPDRQGSGFGTGRWLDRRGAEQPGPQAGGFLFCRVI